MGQLSAWKFQQVGACACSFCYAVVDSLGQIWILRRMSGFGRSVSLEEFGRLTLRQVALLGGCRTDVQEKK